MHNANIPDYTELPTNKRLIRSTIIAVISAAVILVTIVLPSEYGIDPTGIGSITGLKRMGEIKSSLAEELEADQSSATPPMQSAESTDSTPNINDPQIETADRTDTMSATLAPGKSTEIKLTMTKDSAVEFLWFCDTSAAFFDLHGDSNEINYHVYEKGTESSMKGTLVAAFDGNHGWYWKNRTDAPMTITLTTTGRYQDIKEIN